jgi:enoyl-CoA hydratase/carnithine racemase
MLVRLSRASVVSIALIRGRATGVGSELALARHAFRKPRKSHLVAV